MIINVANAQLFQAIVSGGLNLAQVEGDEVSGFYKAGLTAGVGVMMPLQPSNLKSAWRASLELIYNQRGAYEKVIFTTKAPFGYSLKLHYIDIPVMVHYKEPRMDFMLGVGFQYGRMFQKYEQWKLPEPPKLGLYRPLDTNKLPNFNNNELSIVVDARFRIWQRLKCGIRWQYGLTSIRSDVAFSNGMEYGTDGYYEVKRDYHNHWLTLRLIYVINERLTTEKDRNINRNRY
ncbi:MAG: PorT family protein [Bacteroidales bacterium]|nr:PorT family protein [Bacteroidales bacterium]